MSSSNYPVGSDTSDAPWNQADRPALLFKVNVEQSLSRVSLVQTDDYIEGEPTESADHDWNGWYTTYEPGVPDTSQTDWAKAYGGKHLTPLQLIEEAKLLAQQEIDRINTCLPNLMEGQEKNDLLHKLRHAQHILEECDGWVSESLEIQEG